MNILQLKHLVKSAANITRSNRIVVVGSQAILGNCPDVPAAALINSMELDVFPLSSPEKAELIDGQLGEGSPFQDEFACYAHGYSPEEEQFPKNWRSRLKRVDIENCQAKALCLCTADLAAMKLDAGRPKDLDFVTLLFKYELLDEQALMKSIEEMEERHSCRAKRSLAIVRKRGHS